MVQRAPPAAGGGEPALLPARGEEIADAVGAAGLPRSGDAAATLLKGGAGRTLEVDIEGGSIGDLTLHVSDQVTMQPGDRAVFYLERGPRGRIVPHLRGQGVIKLDAAGRVPGSSLTLEMIRRETAAGLAR